MLPYWVLFSAGSALAMSPLWRRGSAWTVAYGVAIGLLLWLFIGLRFSVGGDWDTYEIIFLSMSGETLAGALLLGDPAYNLINWVLGDLGGDIWHVNLICAAIFTYGLIRLCAGLPLPSVALLAAIPYLIIVVGMGFTRQATAIGCIMAAVAGYQGRFSLRWAAWLALAVLFHKSAIFMVPIFIFSSSRNYALNISLGAAIGLLLLVTLVLGSLDRNLEVYIGGGMQSSGAGLRLALMMLAVALFFLFIDRRRELLDTRHRLWRNMAIMGALLLPAFMFISSSTVVDRLSFLLLPFQVAVYSCLPSALTASTRFRYLIIAGIVAFNTLILGVWLYFAEFANYWLPYRNVLFEPYLFLF